MLAHVSALLQNLAGLVSSAYKEISNQQEVLKELSLPRKAQRQKRFLLFPRIYPCLHLRISFWTSRNNSSSSASSTPSQKLLLKNRARTKTTTTTTTLIIASATGSMFPSFFQFFEFRIAIKPLHLLNARLTAFLPKVKCYGLLTLLFSSPFGIILKEDYRGKRSVEI